MPEKQNAGTATGTRPPPSIDIHVRDVCAAAAAVHTVAEFKDWIRNEVRHVLPHGALACGHGRLTPAGVTTDYVLTVDYPAEHLETIRNRSGGIETPLMRRWFQTGSPVLFDAAQPWPDVPADWLAHFRQHDLVNAAVHACYDEERRIGTYFSFHRLPPPLGQLQRAILIGMTPLLHETLMRVIASVDTDIVDITERIDCSEPTEVIPLRYIAARSNGAGCLAGGALRVL